MAGDQVPNTDGGFSVLWTNWSLGLALMQLHGLVLRNSYL